MKPKIAYTRPSITDLEVRYAIDAARDGWGDHCYDYIGRFQTAFARHLGVKHAIATSSCTGALHLGLAALGVGVGDEVVLADTNWVATVAPIVHLGARPVFVDISSSSWCLDPARVASAVTARTKVIIATHLYGNLCDMDALLAIGEARRITVIEDAAEALGSVFRGRRAGSLGQVGCFSFHGSKTVTTGEGGMLVTNDSELFERVATLANHGRVAGQVRQFWPEVVGYKFRMSNIQAAIGLAQVERIDKLVARKREIMSWYRQRLALVAGISMNPEPAGSVIGAWMPNVVFDASTGVTREDLVAAFRRENIDARVFFYPLSSLPMFQEVRDNRVAYDVAARAINLPSYHDMSQADQERVASVLLRVLADGGG